MSKRAFLFAAVCLAAVLAASLGARETHAAGLCALRTQPFVAGGATASATFTVVSVPCTVNLISYQSLTGGTRLPVDSVSRTYTTAGTYTLTVRLVCGSDNQVELFLGSPPPDASNDIGAAAFTPQCGSGGAFTQGYWKNHPEAWLGFVQVGTAFLDTAQGVAVLQTPPKGGDATLILAHQLIAAELNVALGSDASCIAGTIAAANALLATYPVGSGLKSSSAAGQQATQLANTLDAYNSGRLCAPSGE